MSALVCSFKNPGSREEKEVRSVAPLAGRRVQHHPDGDTPRPPLQALETSADGGPHRLPTVEVVAGPDADVSVENRTSRIEDVLRANGHDVPVSASTTPYRWDTGAPPGLLREVEGEDDRLADLSGDHWAHVPALAHAQALQDRGDVDAR